MADSGQAYLQFDGIGKSFPGVRALDSVSFGVAEGTVHALLGENGAGKSTLLKILSGVYQPNEGLLTFGGRPQTLSNTAEAIAAGVAVIYQELQLVPQMNVAENLFLGHLPQRLGMVNRSKLMEKSLGALDSLGEAIDPKVKLGNLSIGQRQMVEIAKALTRDAKIIAFDEPTSSLSSREVDKLFAVIAQLKAAGKVILYVTHRMEEVYQVCDSATVLRDGRHIETFPSIAAVSQAVIVNRMVGRELEDVFPYEARPLGPPALEVGEIAGRGLNKPVSFSVAQGEILGFFGLVGAGRTELMKLIFGAERRTGGWAKVCGVPASLGSPGESIREGVVFCPEDRKKEGVIAVRSVMENLNVSGRRHFSPMGFFIDERKERANAQTYVDRLAIRTPSLAQLAMNLSGGNQQKVILARWLCEELRVVLLDEPTRGIDVGAKREIYNIIQDLAKQGIGVVAVSSELPEVLGICDRIAVMRQGALVGIVDRAEATQERILEMALPVGVGASTEAGS
jgi:L-arabinose transport system ATP-binding protein